MEWIMLHDSQSEFYRSPFGAVSCGEDMIFRLEIAKSINSQSVLLRMWREGLGEVKIPLKVWREEDSSRVFQVKFTVPEKPGIIWYYFIINEQDKTYYYGNKTDNLGGIGEVYNYEPPSYQITVYKKGTKTPDWFKEAVMYQIFPDRFYNGEPDKRVLNAKKGSMLHAHWDNTPYYIRDVDTKRIVAYDFFGGNLQGVIEKLPYLKELGITVIYFNPIFAAPSNHRYDTADYKTVDGMLGNNSTFKELCAKAKEIGIYIFLDGVFSHTGSDSIYFNKENNYPSLGAYQSKESPYYNWYKFYNHPDDYESWWGIDTLPNVEEMEPSYVDFIIEGEDSVIKYWMKLGVKGWRLDVADELPDEFIKKINTAMKQVDADAVLIGEVWEDASNKQSYGKLRDYLQGEELDSVMNYPFRSILLDFMLGKSDAYYTHRRLMSLKENYPTENFYAMMNLLGSHDVPRILTLLGEAPYAESLSVFEQAVYKLPAIREKLAIARLKMLVLWQMTFPGVPSLYYGDEAGLQGYKDPFNRGTYPWGRENTELLKWYKQLIALRHKYDVFTTGELISLPVNDNVYAYVRRIAGGVDIFSQPKQDNTAIVLFNRCVDREISIELNVRQWCYGVLRDLLNNSEFIINNGMLKLTLKPLEGKVLLQKEINTFERGCGVLMHPTALPAKYGIGDLGKGAYEFINFLYNSKQSLWQILPLNPPGYGQSPYQCLSAFAGNPLLISLGKLVTAGLLPVQVLANSLDFNKDKIDFEQVKNFKDRLFAIAFDKFKQQEHIPEYEKFLEENKFWVDDYALFMSLCNYFGNEKWSLWPKEVASCQSSALEYYRKLLKEQIDYQLFLQFIFYTQWQELKRYAKQRKIKIIGDIPIFVSINSSDVWANQHLFKLDEQGKPITVAGVPPDYFSKTGQLWGNPHYNWDEMAKDEYLWWRKRFENILKQVDIIRLDHFRGFEAFWEIPLAAETAAEGWWTKGPGAHFFATIKKYFKDLPIIVEDLGVITNGVEDLKHQFLLPGIKVLQFAFEYNDKDELRSLVFEKNLAIYTGTHDNDTVCGWYEELLREQPLMANAIKKAIDFHGESSEEFCWQLIEFAYNSNANTVIIPLQDILSLGCEARMNIPGTVGDHNWGWRCKKELLTDEVSKKLAALSIKYHR